MTLVVHALVLINIDSNMHGDEIKIETCRLNPTAPRFNPRDDRPLAGQNIGRYRDCSDNAQILTL